MLVELIRPAQSPRRFANCRTAATTSALMIPQQDLKKASMKPSGPGALTEGKEKTASFISSSSNGASKSERSWCWILMFSQAIAFGPQRRCSKVLLEVIEESPLLVVPGNS